MILDLYDKGFKDLVCVLPPDADLAPTSSVPKEARGKAPGVRRVDGKWTGYPFLTAGQPTRPLLEKWLKWGANVGLMGQNFPGVDIDVDNPTLAKLVRQEAEKFFGPAPARLSREPRVLLLYRTEHPFGRIAATIRYKEQEHKVEVLGVGRQYLVYGKHPSGTEYRWEEEPTDPTTLNPITAEQVMDFFLHLRTLLEGRAEVFIQGTGDTTARAAVPQDSLKAPSLEVLKEVVDQIPNRFPDRESYIQFGYAVKAAGGDEALDIFQSWAARWEGGENDPSTVEADWSRMHPPFSIGWTWLQEIAEAEGYFSAAEEFEADPNAVPLPSLPKEERAELQVGVIDYTDTWVVEKVAAMLRSTVRYVPETGCWHVWDGHAWTRDRRNLGEHLVRQALTRLSAEIRERAKVHPAEEEAKKMFKFAASLQSRGALTKAVPELQAHPRLTLTLDQFDADPWLLNTPGGIVNLRTGRITPPDPTKLQSKSTAVAPRLDVEGNILFGAPARWEAFLDEATNGDKELQHWLQKQVGYSLTASTQEQTLTFIHGPPLTGKSVFVEAIGGLFGSYHENAPMETFSSAKGDRHPTDLAKLAGARLVSSVETQEGRSWDTQRVKSLTGGDMISARFMRQDYFDFRPTFKILIVGNHEPEVRGVDEAMMRRLRIVPFEHSPVEVDRLLGTKLKEEWPGILSWAIEGCLLWLQEGLTPPAVVQARTAEYRREEDPVGQFVLECCVVEEGGWISRQDLYDAWARWCHMQGEDPGTQKQLKRRFKTQEILYGIGDERRRDGTKHLRGYSGIRLAEE